MGANAAIPGDEFFDPYKTTQSFTYAFRDLLDIKNLKGMSHKRMEHMIRSTIPNPYEAQRLVDQLYEVGASWKRAQERNHWGRLECQCGEKHDPRYSFPVNPDYFRGTFSKFMEKALHYRIREMTKDSGDLAVMYGYMDSLRLEQRVPGIYSNPDMPIIPYQYGDGAPVDAFISGERGSGKSNYACIMMERLLRQGQSVITNIPMEEGVVDIDDKTGHAIGPDEKKVRFALGDSGFGTFYPLRQPLLEEDVATTGVDVEEGHEPDERHDAWPVRSAREVRRIVRPSGSDRKREVKRWLIYEPDVLLAKVREKVGPTHRLIHVGADPSVETDDVKVYAAYDLASLFQCLACIPEEQHSKVLFLDEIGTEDSFSQRRKMSSGNVDFLKFLRVARKFEVSIVYLSPEVRDLSTDILSYIDVYYQKPSKDSVSVTIQGARFADLGLDVEDYEIDSIPRTVIPMDTYAFAVWSMWGLDLAWECVQQTKNARKAIALFFRQIRALKRGYDLNDPGDVSRYRMEFPEEFKDEEDEQEDVTVTKHLVDAQKVPYLVVGDVGTPEDPKTTAVKTEAESIADALRDRRPILPTTNLLDEEWRDEDGYRPMLKSAVKVETARDMLGDQSTVRRMAELTGLQPNTVRKVRQWLEMGGTVDGLASVVSDEQWLDAYGPMKPDEETDDSDPEARDDDEDMDDWVEMDLSPDDEELVDILDEGDISPYERDDDAYKQSPELRLYDLIYGVSDDRDEEDG